MKVRLPTIHPMSYRTKANIGRSLKTAMVIATVYFAFVVIATALGGNQLRVLGGSYPAVFVAYYGTALVGGTLVGLLLPYTRTLLGLMTVSVIAAFPCILFFLQILKPEEPMWLKLLISAILSLFAGPGYALALRN